jgi:hypothetical protein
LAALSSQSQQFVKNHIHPAMRTCLKKTPGRWINNGNAFYPKVSPQQKKEFQNRLDAMHIFMFNLYPSPLAFDAGRFDFATDQEFGSQLKFDRSSNGKLHYIEVNGTSTIFYSYTAIFCAYHCGREAYEIMRARAAKREQL